MILLLSFAILLPVFQTVALAESSGVELSVSYERFTAEKLTVENASANVQAEGSVLIYATGKAPVINMDISPIAAKTEANSLRIVLKNLSGSDCLRIGYVFKNPDGAGEYNETEFAIERSEEIREYIVPVKSPDTLIKLTLTFGGENVSGDIELVSVGAVSFCFDNRTYCGEKRESVYYRDKGIAVVSGSVSYDTILANPDAEIVLYRLDPSEKIETLGADHPRVASCPMTLDFSFTFDIENTVQACARYFAAVLTENGRILPITAECYLDENTNHESFGTAAPGFKGVETNLYAFASGNGSSVAFVDIFLDKLGGNGTNGYLYLLDSNKEYYFNREYVESIDRIIKSYRESEVNFYLRFLIDAKNSDEEGMGWKSTPPKTTKYISIYPSTDEAVENLYACADFLISRYTEEKNGSLMKGIILGRSLDNAYLFNYCGDSSLGEYSDIISRVYSIIKRAADKSGKVLDLVLPFSGNKMGYDELVTRVSRDEQYPTDILADSILCAFERYGLDTSSLCFMLEKQTEIGLPDLYGAYMTDNNYAEFSALVGRLAEKYGGFSSNIIYCWFPSAYMLTYDFLELYVYKYNYLASKNNVKAFVVSVFERIEYVDTGALSSAKQAEGVMLASVKNTYKYIDTYRHADVVGSFAESLDIAEWKDIIPDYVERLMIKRNVSESQLGYLLPEGTVGNYKMWDFTSSNSTGGWEISDGCNSLSVYTPTPDLSRSLVAVFSKNKFDFTGGETGSIIYKTDDFWKMDAISGMSFDFCIYDENFSPEGASYLFDVRVTVYADEGYVDYYGVVKGGEPATVYADITRLSNVRSVRISFKCLEENAPSNVFSVCVDNISMQSKKYDSNKLEDLIISGELTNKNEASSSEIKIFAASSIAVASGIVLVALIGFVFFLARKKRQY
jgi:hypothetical protein